MQELREIIRAEAEDGRTVFFSSHLLGEVQAVCDRIGIMNGGRLVAIGTPDELRTQLDLGEVIRFDVTDVPDDLVLTAIDGVEAVSTVDGTIEVTVTDSRAKIETATRLAERTTVLDIASDDSSLEHIFDQYTSNGQGATSEHDRGASTIYPEGNA